MKALRLLVLSVSWFLGALAVVGGIWMWVWSLEVTLMYWGWVGVLIGVLLAGIGVIGTAVVALLLHGNWTGILALALNMGLIWLLWAGTVGSFALAETMQDKTEA